MDASRAPSPLVMRLSIGALCLIWGSTWLVVRVGLEDLPPLFGGALRFTLAWAVFFLMAPILARREGGRRPPRGLAVTYGVTNIALTYGLVYWAEQTLPSGLASLLWGVFPLLMAAGSHYLLPGERLSPGNGLGFLLGFAGTALLFATDLPAIDPELVWVAALFLLSPLAAAVGNLLIKRDGAQVSSVLLNRDGFLIGALLLWLAVPILEGGAAVRWTPTAILSVLYLALMGSVVTFGLYFWLLRWAPANQLALIAYVTPVLALFLGWSLGGEPIGPYTLPGAGLILLGVALARRRPPRPRPDAIPRRSP